MAKCKYCGEEVRNFPTHQWEAHREQAQVQLDAAKAKYRGMHQGNAHKVAPPGGKVGEVAPPRGNDGQSLGQHIGENGQPLGLPIGQPDPPAGKKEKLTRSTQASTFEEAHVVAFRTQEIRVSSQLLQVAKKATEDVWGWPVMDVQDWLDSYLHMTLEQRGIVIGAYQVVGGNDDDG